MRKPDTLVIDGRAYSWQRICELRRIQLDAWRKAQAEQLALFTIQEDHRPTAERTARSRWTEPTFLDAMKNEKGISG